MQHPKKGQLSPQKQRFLEVFSKDLQEDRHNGLAVTADEARRMKARERNHLLRLTDDEFAEHEQRYFEQRAALRDVD